MHDPRHDMSSLFSVGSSSHPPQRAVPSFTCTVAQSSAFAPRMIHLQHAICICPCTLPPSTVASPGGCSRA